MGHSPNIACVILGRDGKKNSFELLYILKDGKEPLHRAWRLANSIEEQERRLGKSKFEARVFKEDDYFNDKITSLNPPKDFDFTLETVKDFNKSEVIIFTPPPKPEPVKKEPKTKKIKIVAKQAESQPKAQFDDLMLDKKQ